MEKLERRFWSKVKKGGADDCWMWTSATWGSGYGFFWVGGKKRNEYAHRLSVILDGREIPQGHVVMHSCDEKLCVNPRHLTVGTVQDNSDDCVRKGRQAKGERNGGGGKLTWKDADFIRSSSLSGPILGSRFGVSRRTVNAIKRGEMWAR